MTTVDSQPWVRASQAHWPCCTPSAARLEQYSGIARSTMDATAICGWHVGNGLNGVGRAGMARKHASGAASREVQLVTQRLQHTVVPNGTCCSMRAVVTSNGIEH